MAMLAVYERTGIPVLVSAGRSSAGRGLQLSRDEITRRRNKDWLEDFEVGRPDPITGKLRKRSVAEIAALYGKGEQTVRDGIRAAREIREAHEDAV